MGRPRKAGNRDLPANLYRTHNSFEYVHPITGNRHYWRVPKERAVAAAKQLNEILLPRERDLVSKVMGDGHTIRDAVNLFRKEELETRKWGEKTKLERATRLRRIEADIGGNELAAYGVREVAEYLKTVTKSPSARAQYRYLLALVFTEACQEGWIEQNPVLMTKKPRVARKRARLTLEGFETVHRAAGDLGMSWLQNAMDLSLLTLARRYDCCALRFADAKDGWLHLVPQKTEGSTGVRLRIQISGALGALVDRCRDNVASPFLVHRLPEKARPAHVRARLRGHHTEILPAQLSRGFEEARSHSRAFADVESPPTFHEIRSLGADRYRQMGWPEARIQALLGHASIDMTRHYLKGHEAPWTDVVIG